MAQTEIQYREGRRSGTEVDIQQCFGNLKQLKRLLRDRKGLARIYADDGAIQTARLIEEIDIALIQETIRQQTCL